MTRLNQGGAQQAEQKESPKLPSLVNVGIEKRNLPELHQMPPPQT
tara:strand:- start:81 stop:215 length:135 start_codon:yes stop_codon:yes gene_type:complete